MCWRTSSQLFEKSSPTFESRVEQSPFLTPLEGSNKHSKHLKANISLMFFPKSSGNSGTNSIKSETKKSCNIPKRLIKKIIQKINYYYNKFFFFFLDRFGFRIPCKTETSTCLKRARASMTQIHGRIEARLDKSSSMGDHKFIDPTPHTSARALSLNWWGRRAEINETKIEILTTSTWSETI